jgi:multiple sugar transport system permease protein
VRAWYRLLFPKNYLDRRKRAGFFFVLPALAFFGFVYLLPLAQSVMYSFYRIQPGGAREFVGLGRYEKVLTDPSFWSAVWNTVQLLLFSVPLTVVLALAVALGLNRIASLKWRNLWASMYFLPFATSLVAAALIWQWLYDPVYGFLNYALGYLGIPPQKWLQSLTQVKPSIAVVSIWVRIGFDTMIFLAALQSIPEEYYEAARIDGAGAWQRLRWVTIPTISPVILFAVVIGTIEALQLFDQAYVGATIAAGSASSAGDPSNDLGFPEDSTLFYPVLLYQQGFRFFNMGYAAAMAVLLLIVSFAITMIIVRNSRRWVHYAGAGR